MKSIKKNPFSLNFLPKKKILINSNKLQMFNLIIVSSTNILAFMLYMNIIFDLYAINSHKK